ncbi:MULTISPECIES: hypothetical protein [unclassified Roseitalea]|uniref:hypothetical protein n=1 Tax=unclassified Roseitalea TaxID=2639107 RepID=UPI00273E5D88|nr:MULTISPECIES: hypothetical protein [unclassified Roseitalea]
MADNAATVGTLSAAALFTAIAAMVLVDLQIIAVAGAAIWAIASHVHSGLTGLVVAAAIIGPVALWLCWQVGVMAIAAERADAD